MHRQALLLIDLQAGAFDGVRCPPVAGAGPLLSNALLLLQSARACGIPVVFVQHCGAAGDPLEDGTPHGDFTPTLRPQAGDGLIRKREPDAFERTELAALLHGLGVDGVVLCGLASEDAIAATAHGALLRRLKLTLAADAHGTWPRAGSGAEAIRDDVNLGLAARGARLLPAAVLAADWRAAASA